MNESKRKDGDAPPEGQVRAPFTAEQIESLNGFQRAGFVHPFTCANRIEHGDDVLVATYAGMKCPSCDYIQTWAWYYMANNAWKPLPDAFFPRLGEETK